MDSFWECKLVQSILKTACRLLINLSIELPCATAVLFIGVYPKECKSVYNEDTCTPIFIAALFTIAKLWKQPRCHTTDVSIKKM
jgi:hypothetical protein